LEPVEARKSISAEIRQRYRNEWLAILRKHPTWTAHAIRAKYSRVDSWLRSHDPEWRLAHSPKPQKRKTPLPRVDWQDRDAKISKKIEPVIAHLKSLPGQPVRITITLIGFELGLNLSIMLKKLPHTLRIMQPYLETFEQWAVNRIRWAADEYRNEGFHPFPSDLLRRADVGDKLREMPAIVKEVKVALKSFC
jgi:hypothetical protein